MAFEIKCTRLWPHPITSLTRYQRNRAPPRRARAEPAEQPARAHQTASAEAVARYWRLSVPSPRTAMMTRAVLAVTLLGADCVASSAAVADGLTLTVDSKTGAYTVS